MMNHLPPAVQAQPSRQQKTYAETTAPVRSVRILRLKAVCDKTGMSRSTIYDWLNPDSSRYDPSFPKQIRLGMQSVGWPEAEIDDWLYQRIASARDE
ncbi:Predicted transcriptional regulator [Serratia proteamaculans]|nr:Predicted transcriptional regulator [Serratia proteamaculans]